MSFIIKDWAGNRKFPGNSFDSFQEAWDFLYQNVDNSAFDASGNLDEDLFQEFFVEEEEE